MPDNWGYVAAAYGVAALFLGLYWRRLVRGEADLRARGRRGVPRSSRAALASPRGTRGSPPQPEHDPRGSRS
jgi:hypothetical protein